jgi:hypothetical protein
MDMDSKAMIKITWSDDYWLFLQLNFDRFHKRSFWNWNTKFSSRWHIHFTQLSRYEHRAVTLNTDGIFYQYFRGHTIAPAVSCWLPTAADRVWSSGICGAGAGILRVLQFPLSVFITPIASQSPLPIIWGWYNRPEVAAVQWTWSHPTRRKNIIPRILMSWELLSNHSTNAC